MSRRRLVLVLAMLALAVGVPTGVAWGGGEAGGEADAAAEAVQDWNELTRLGAEVLDQAGIAATVEVDKSGLAFLSVADGDEPAAAGALVEAVLACAVTD